MVDDSRVIWNVIGEPPESPWGYQARTGEEAPQSVYAAWRKWNTQEQALVEKAAESMSGQSADEILTSLGYRNEPDAGKSMFARYKSGEKANVLENIAGDAFKTAVGRGHITWNPATNRYENLGLSTDPNRPDQIWDEKGRAVSGTQYGWGNAIAGKGMINKPVSSGSWNTMGTAPNPNATAAASASQGPQRGQAGYRPNLRTDANNANYGSWGSAYGRQLRQGSSAQKPTNSWQYNSMGAPNV